MLFEGSFTTFFIDKKVVMKSQNSRNKDFSSFFCLLMEGCGSGTLLKMQLPDNATKNISKTKSSAVLRVFCRILYGIVYFCKKIL
jgi:hypothetical protein